MAMLSRDQIIGARNAKLKKVKIDALGGDVVIRVLSIGESDKFGAESEGMSANETAMLYAAYLIGNEDGSRMFEDHKELADIPAKAIMEIADHGNRLNGVSDEEVESTAKK